jgi:hypothetical protein
MRQYLTYPATKTVKFKNGNSILYFNLNSQYRADTGIIKIYYLKTKTIIFYNNKHNLERAKTIYDIIYNTVKVSYLKNTLQIWGLKQ